MPYFTQSTITCALWTSVIMALASTTNAQASGFCSTLNEISSRTSENVQTLTSTELFPEIDLAFPTIDHQDSCQISPSEQYLLTCTWQFPFRTAAATDSFDKVQKLISQCVDDPDAFTKDQNVNHPDYYEAYYYDFMGRVLSVSLKDKGSLQKTLVFLRMK